MLIKKQHTGNGRLNVRVAVFRTFVRSRGVRAIRNSFWIQVGRVNVPPSVGENNRGLRGRLCRECNSVNVADHADPAWYVLTLVTNGT